MAPHFSQWVHAHYPSHVIFAVVWLLVIIFIWNGESLGVSASFELRPTMRVSFKPARVRPGVSVSTQMTEFLKNGHMIWLGNNADTTQRERIRRWGGGNRVGECRRTRQGSVSSAEQEHPLSKAIKRRRARSNEVTEWIGGRHATVSWSTDYIRANTLPSWLLKKHSLFTLIIIIIMYINFIMRSEPWALTWYIFQTFTENPFLYLGMIVNAIVYVRLRWCVC